MNLTITQEDFYPFYDKTSNRIEILIILPVLCVLGILFSILNIITLNDLKLKDKAYYYLIVKTIIQIIMLSSGALIPYVSCTTCSSFQTYGSQFLKIMIFKFSNNFLYLFLSIVQVMIISDRYCAIKAAPKLMIEYKDKVILIILAIICGFTYFPCLFGDKIVFIQNTGKYVLKPTGFGSMQFYTVFLNSMWFFENILTVFILIPFNIIVCVKYFQELRKKITIISLIKSEKELLKKNLTKMIIIESSMFVMGRIAYGCFRVSNILVDFKFDNYCKYTHLAFIFITYFTYSFHFFICLTSNPQFRNAFKIKFNFK